MSKLPHELSLQELLDSLKNAPADTKIEINTDVSDKSVLSFIQAFQISDGKKLVPIRFFYKLYRMWNRDRVIPVHTLSKEMSLYLPTEYKGNKFYVLVKDNILKLAKHLQELEKKHRTVKSRSKKWQSQFNKFLSENNLEAGEIFVEVDILYYLYNNWLDKTRKRSLFSYEKFVQMCEFFFDTKRISNGKIHWHGVGPSIKDMIDKDSVERWRQGRRKYGKTKKDVKRDYFKPMEGREEVILYHEKNKKK